MNEKTAPGASPAAKRIEAPLHAGLFQLHGIDRAVVRRRAMPPTASSPCGRTARAFSRCAATWRARSVSPRRASSASTRKARAATGTTARTMWPSTRRCVARAIDRPAGEAAVDARRRVHVGAVRLGDGHEDARRSRCVGSASSTGSTSSGAIRIRRARAGARASICLRAWYLENPSAADVPRRRAAAVGRLRSQRDSALRFSDPAHREALSTGAAAPHLGAAHPRRLCERLRARVVHGRDGGRGRRRPGRVPVAAPHRSARAGGDRGGGTQGAGWQPGAKLAASGNTLRGRGIGFARYKNLACYCAVVAEVEVDRASGVVRVTRAVSAVDAGLSSIRMASSTRSRAASSSPRAGR